MHICMHKIHFLIHLSINGHLGCFYDLASINNAAVRWECRYLFEILISFLSGSGIAGSYGSLIFNLYRNIHSSCTTLHSQQQYTSVPFSPYPSQHLLFLGWFFKNNTCRYEVVSHSGFDLHSLMISDVEHLFM